MKSRFRDVWSAAANFEQHCKQAHIISDLVIFCNSSVQSENTYHCFGYRLHLSSCYLSELCLSVQLSLRKFEMKAFYQLLKLLVVLQIVSASVCTITSRCLDTNPYTVHCHKNTVTVETSCLLEVPARVFPA